MTTQNHAARLDPGRIDIDAGRRAFIRQLGLGAAGACMFGGAGFTTSAQAQAITDTDILNFALNLEYLEAEFYLRAAFGRGLEPADFTASSSPAGAVTGGRQVNFATASIRNYAREIAADEENHVQFLRAALGDDKVSRPKISLDDSFTAAARAAGLIGQSDQFDAFANEGNFLLAAFIFEDVGVTAYKGAAPLLSNKTFLAAAAGILAVEAYHAGEIRTLLYARSKFAETRKISNLRDAVDGGANKDFGVGNADEANIVPTDADGIAFGRSPGQVLNIVYLGRDKTKGGFFPNGLKGTIR